MSPTAMTKVKVRTIIIDLLIVVVVPFVLTACFGIYGAVRPQKIVSHDTPKQYGLAYTDVTLTTEDGLKLTGWYVPRKGPATDKAVIVLHGYPADKGGILPRAAFLADRYNLLFIDFRYFGGSEGFYTTVGVNETKDLAAAVKYLQEKGMHKIGVYGFSMGGAVALMGQAKIHGIDAVVAESSYADLAEMASEMYKYLGPLRGPLTWTTEIVAKVALRTDLHDVSPENAVRNTDEPLLIVHSRTDEVIPYSNAERIFAAMKDDPNAEKLVFDTGGHGEPSIELAQRMSSFFAKYLGLPDDMKAANAAGAPTPAGR